MPKICVLNMNGFLPCHGNAPLGCCFVFIASALHAHLRGKVRFGWVRADRLHGADCPFNSLMVLFSKVGSQPHLNPKTFPS